MIITIFLPLSRPKRVKHMVSQVGKQIDYVNSANDNDIVFNIVAVADNSDIDVKKLHSDLSECAANFVRTHETGNSGAPEANAMLRRQRIANVFELGQSLIPAETDLVFVIEDDTDLRANALYNLIEGYNQFKSIGAKVGVLSGVQAGRWGFKIIGAWKCDDPKNPTVVETLPFTRSSIFSKVDAAGFYCFITPYKLFKKAKFIFNQFGADVNYGFYTRQKGYDNFIDWTVVAGHVVPNGVLYPDEKCEVVKYEYINDGWIRTEPKPKRLG